MKDCDINTGAVLSRRRREVGLGLGRGRIGVLLLEALIGASGVRLGSVLNGKRPCPEFSGPDNSVTFITSRSELEG